jgi:D-alanine--poly(phosphoribitol) ligase subunit 1
MKDLNLVSGFFSHATQNPASPCLMVDEQLYSYEDIVTLVKKVAGWLQINTPQENARVGVLTGRSLEAYVGILAAAWSGRSYVPLSPKSPGTYLKKIIETAQLDALIIDEQGFETLGPDLAASLPRAILHPFASSCHCGQINIDNEESLTNATPLAAPLPVASQAMAYLMFTSGSTGEPKGIMVTVENVLHMLDVLQERYQVGKEDRLSQFFELPFDLSVFDIFMATNSGASLYVIPENQLLSPAQFINKNQLTLWFSVPSLVGILLQMKLLKPDQFPSLRLSLFCGEALPAASAEAWQEAAPESRVENLYGPTEATVACLLQEYGVSGTITPDRNIVAIGKPFQGLYAAIVDQNLNILPQGEKGELAVSGPQVAAGYWQNEKLTGERFPTLDHPELGRTRWYLTGDLAYQDAEDNYHFLGRVDYQIKVRGIRIELEEIEYHLREASGLDNVLAVPLPDLGQGILGVIGVIETDGADVGRIKAEMQKRVPRFLVPKRIILKDKIPRNKSGKLDRKGMMSILVEEKAFSTREVT